MTDPTPHNLPATDRGKSEFIGIEWTDKSWNPVTGCDKISPGCKYCYAETLAKRLHAMGNPRYGNEFRLTLHRDKITEPLRWRKPCWIFVNSMSDLLHDGIKGIQPDPKIQRTVGVPDAFILDCVDTMVRANWHRYQWLTKRAHRWPSISEQVLRQFGSWPRNVLPGVTIENHNHLHRMNNLGRVGDDDTVRMLSIEPLLGSLLDPSVPRELGVRRLAAQLTENRIGWVITGGESYRDLKKVRWADLDWFREIRDACQIADVPFFHKQHGGGITKKSKRGGKDATLDGVLHHEMPVVWSAPAPAPRRPAQGRLL